MTEPIRLLIVDDEPLAREKIRAMLKGDPNFEISGECSSGTEAVEAIRTLQPELVLLDVQMPELGGFQVLEAIEPESMPLVIFITAYDQHAVRAFEVNALDYLLKPFDRERFDAALERARVALREFRDGSLNHRILSLLEELKAEKRYLARLVIKNGGRVFFLSTAEIEWIEAEGNYVSVHTSKKSYMLREAVSSLEARLDPRQFVRIHRSAMVRIDRIRELQPWTHGEYHVILMDGTQLTLSRNFRDNLNAILGRSL